MEHVMDWPPQNLNRIVSEAGSNYLDNIKHSVFKFFSSGEKRSRKRQQ